MLIRSPRQTEEDLEVWERNERVDAATCRLRAFRLKISRALDDMAAFVSPRCYIGVSWGKDSTVLAHLAWRLATERGTRIPLVWVRREPVDNPECYLVRDAFAARFSGEVDMHEIRLDCEWDPAHPQCWWVAGDPRRTPDARPKQQGFARAARLFGDRYISGVRAAESGSRVMRMRAFGVVTERTCAPIGWWSTAEVFAYLHAHQLPVHPSYAMTGGIMWDRERIRVGGIGSHHGQGHGRAEWERMYYPEVAALANRCSGT